MHGLHGRCAKFSQKFFDLSFLFRKSYAIDHVDHVKYFRRPKNLQNHYLEILISAL